MFVYAIVNRENQKVYIGRTVKKSLRAYLRHKVWSALTKRYNGRSYLFNAMQKYPSHVWSIHPLISCLTTEWQLDLWEKAMIYAFDSTNPNIGYNICKGGAGHKRDRMKGHPTSPETINKIKAARALQDETPRVEGCRKYAKEHKEEMSARLSHEAHVLGGRAGAREAKQRAAKVSIRRGSHRKAQHIRWHVNTGRPNPACALCTGDTNGLQCAFCGEPAVTILPKSNLPCCKYRAYRCPFPRFPMPCFGCKEPAIKLNKFGPVCGNPCPALDRLKKERTKRTMAERYGDANSALHVRWHVNRGRASPGCPLCIPKTS